MLALLAGRSGGLLVPSTSATQSGVPRSTLNRYLESLAAVFLVKQIPAWTSGSTGRAVGTPKLAYVDSGIACHLLGVRHLASRLGDRFVAGFVLYAGQQTLSFRVSRRR